ncbi:hypothetical protein GCM10011383_04830 [Hymenobacter cavernae]|uniref:DUF3298 domain-containing protein n=1 Tax=Hymenobacter cavernae TaxID=2044852 RepID=A0ABQ1TJT7_9BACT|nr:hypothetical protein GCM10011383_04830 [Hymenobacter cavernae]
MLTCQAEPHKTPKEPTATVSRPLVADAVDFAGVYDGKLGDKYPIRLLINAQEPNDSVWWGEYYYLSKGELISLRGHLDAAGNLKLREYGAGDNKPATGVFTVQLPTAQELTGTWQAPDGTRNLSVALRRYDGAAPPGRSCAVQVRERTYFGRYTVPIITTSDKGVNKLLAKQFSIEAATGTSLADLREQAPPKDAIRGFMDLSFEENYNANCLLSITQTQEDVGANVNSGITTTSLDLRTGFGIQIGSEIRQEKMAAFVAYCDAQLQQQIAKYVRENGYFDASDSVGLNGQRFSYDNLGTIIIRKDTVALPYGVEYADMYYMMYKQYQSAFAPTISFAALQLYLRPNSPLRRLAPKQQP